MQTTLMGTLLNATGVSQGQIPVAVDASGKLQVAALNSGTLFIGLVGIKAAANLSTGQVTGSTAASTFVPARPTRRSVTLRNIDATNSVYVGPATVSSLTGMLLKGGESISIDFTGLIQFISGAGAPVVSYADTYD